jgi:hypothetical protein
MCHITSKKKLASAKQMAVFTGDADFVGPKIRVGFLGVTPTPRLRLGYFELQLKFSSSCFLLHIRRAQL